MIGILGREIESRICSVVALKKVKKHMENKKKASMYQFDVTTLSLLLFLCKAA
jgi:hypothetical protein